MEQEDILLNKYNEDNILKFEPSSKISKRSCRILNKMKNLLLEKNDQSLYDFIDTFLYELDLDDNYLFTTKSTKTRGKIIYSKNENIIAIVDKPSNIINTLEISLDIYIDKLKKKDDDVQMDAFNIWIITITTNTDTEIFNIVIPNNDIIEIYEDKKFNDNWIDLNDWENIVDGYDFIDDKYFLLKQIEGRKIFLKFVNKIKKRYNKLIGEYDEYVDY
jgi:hypothetical protein